MIDAALQLARSDYRAFLRAAVTAANPQASEPEAHIVEAEDGPISRPDITAGVVRKITAPLRAAAGDR